MGLTEVLIVIATICGVIYFWNKRCFNYWTRYGVPQMDPTPIIGNLKPILTLKMGFGMYLNKIYDDKRFANAPAVGVYIFNQPGLLVRDIELIKSVLIKDFNNFPNRYIGADPHRDPIAWNNLFFVKSPRWKDIRAKVTPVFSSGKIKHMYPLMLEIAKELEIHLSTYKRNSDHSFVEETKEICAHFTTDMIATIAFGIRANSLQNPKSEFRRISRKMFEFDLRAAKDYFIAMFLPKLVSLFRIQIFTEEFSKFSRKIINHIFDERERTGNVRNDLIDILLALKRNGELKDYNNDFLVAQGAVFVTAGFETSSATMSFALLELARRPELQERLREEICEALLKDNGIISYETIMTLEFLGMIVDETLRVYPVLPFLAREHVCGGGEEAYSLKPHYDCELLNGMPVFVPVYAIHHDPQFWNDPDTFDPERFSSENKKLHHSMTYFPFGAGPHNCIGGRFALLQTKIGLVHFLKNHSVSPCEKTPKEVTFDYRAFTLQTPEGIYLKITQDDMYNKRAKL